MHIHLPRPLHGWREFVGEVGIIVLGVLIALGAEQLVESINWQRQVAGANDDLRTELQTDSFEAQERVRLQNCVEQRLEMFDRFIDRPPGYPWRLPDEAPIRLWSSSAWDGAIASGAVAHMSRKQRSAYAVIYSGLVALREFNLEEFKTSAELRMLEGGQTMSEPSRDRLHADVARLKEYNSLIGLGAAQVRDGILAADITLTSDLRSDLSKVNCKLPDPNEQRT